MEEIMKDEILKLIIKKMETRLRNDELDELRNVLFLSLEDYEIVPKSKTKVEEKKSDYYIDSFISSKRLEGCSEKTLKYYSNTIKIVINSISKPIKTINTDDLRYYLSKYQEKNKPSNVTLDNIRRILSSFFTWLEEEDIILKSPVRRIHKVKSEEVVKEVITDEQLVKLKDACNNSRDLALIEILASTGIRVGELVLLNKEDIDFNERSCIVLGKGNKQREVYFDAKTKIHLYEYLKSRKDDNNALFVSMKEPNDRLSISGIEYIVKKLGNKIGIKNVHPHKFRRTLATFAIDKGMPIEQVQKLLGHVKIDTTMHYALVNQNNVKISHRKYLN